MDMSISISPMLLIYIEEKCGEGWGSKLDCTKASYKSAFPNLTISCHDDTESKVSGILCLLRNNSGNGIIHKQEIIKVRE